MSATDKPTPGPWEVDEHGVSSAEVLGIARVYQAATRESWAGSDYATASHCRANARLIAAAPELLEALKGLDEAYCRAGSPLTREERHEDRLRLIAARVAIANATGGEA